RYLYVGPAPRFEPEDLEFTVSKLTLTARVKARVSNELPGQYAQILMRRWKRIYDAFQDPSMSFANLHSVDDVTRKARDAGSKPWLQVAGQYMKHILESSGVDIYSPSTSDDEYKERVLTAILRSYTRDEKMTLQQGLQLAQSLEDPSVLASRRS